MSKAKTDDGETSDETVEARVRSFGGYLLEVREEVKKVTWPDRKETSMSTVVIVVLVVIVSVYLGVVDTVLGWFVRALLG